jgi:Ice-binding-like
MRNSSAQKNHARWSAAACAAALIVFGLLATSWSAAASVIPLGAAENVAILGGSTVTNTGPTTVTGNVALSPGVSVTGFPPGTIVGGSIHIGDALATQAHADAATAYTLLAGETLTTDLSGQNLGGLTLTPGVYHFDTSAQLTGTLALDTGGDPNAAFHFQIGTTLTTAVASAITLLNGSSVNIFWQVGTSATLGVDSVFYGNILADQSITINSGATVNGRAMAINGAVTMDTNIITAPVVPEPSTWFAGALAFGVIGFTERPRMRKFLVKLSGRGSKSA